ncbi:hypothetical protein C0Q70_15460 [Pomacea canaliculata]|uniref:Fibrinogen C-terminal domain-containing protein n=2 Tax=Pomacea canaliculata TaxID=400727 RepID=A0A2T7NUY4_POMCA|nr:hypothetical protein C0Q70_15460 [Pomacea canaliculata]
MPRDYQVSQVVASTSTGALSCTVTCASSPVCNSIVFDPAAKTCHLSQQVAAPDCLNMEDIKDSRIYLEKRHSCKNGATPRGDKCDCVPGYMGDNCELGPMRDCYDYMTIGKAQGTMVRMIRPTDNMTFPVNCLDALSTVMIRRNNKINFTRSWREYRDGFGNISDTHWLGLEKIRILTTQNRSYNLLVQVQLNNTASLYVLYNNFTVSDEKSFYQLHFESVTLNSNHPGDCLSDLRGANFSTYDSDNDGDSSVNCASRHSGGWWFRGNACSTCNPTGQLLQPANGLRTGVDSEVFWIKDLGNIAPYRISIRLQNP